MSQRTIRSILALFAFTLVSATIALAQSTTSLELPATTASNTWQVTQLLASSKGKLFVVTTDHPDSRHTCHVKSFTPDKLVCSRAIGGPRTYFQQQIVALILPGDGHLKLRIVLGINGGLAAAIWGTVVLAPVCPACAVATGIVALALFGAAGAVLIGDEQPDSLFYLAPGQQLSKKLGFVRL